MTILTRAGMAISALVLCIAGALFVSPASAADREPWEAADAIRDHLFAAQTATLAGDTATAGDHVNEATAVAAELEGMPQASAMLLDEALGAAAEAAPAGDGDALSGARGLAQGAIFWGSYIAAREAVGRGDAATAQQWLLIRDFRPSTRFSRPGADATLAVRALAPDTINEALAQLDADLLDTYQARLSEHLSIIADPAALTSRRANSAGIAAAYWRVLSPSFAEQNGAAPEPAAAFDSLLPALLAGDDHHVVATVESLQAILGSFRAAPLSQDDLARRTGQLLRYLALVPVEYDRGVQDNTVLIDLEVQEAVTFMRGAEAAYADLLPALNEIDAEQTAGLSRQIAGIVQHLDAANRKESVPAPAEISNGIEAINNGLSELLPAEWTETTSADADFDVLASVLDQMEAAVRAGDYKSAESARLEGYAIFDFGPEPRLLGFAPQLVAAVDGLFWQGYDGKPGLAQALALEASPDEIAAIRADLDAALEEARLTLGDLSGASGAVITNAAIIVFREGLESVVILAALMGSMVGIYARYRRPMVLGVLLSLAATAVTWWIAQEILSSLTRFGERLEAVVSLIAIGVLLLITNWFFHKAYWKDWMAGFHQQKRQLLTAETGQFLGLVVLGFTSMYREGFETVLFLQALVLEAGATVVLEGVAVGALAVLIVGFITFKLQARLPYKKMLVWTGILIGMVLITMVGKTVHVMQAVGWVGITPIHGLTPPYWAGLWFGIYATWQGVAAQIAAAVFVIGSYYLAEGKQAKRRKQITKPHAKQAS